MIRSMVSTKINTRKWGYVSIGMYICEYFYEDVVGGRREMNGAWRRRVGHGVVHWVELMGVGVLREVVWRRWC